MRRRDLLLTALVIPLLSVTSQRPLAAGPQPARGTFRIGVLANLDTPDMEGLRQGLREHGYIDGSNVTVEWRWSQGRSERLPALATELVRAQPDIIVAVSTLAVTAAKDATSTIRSLVGWSGESGYSENCEFPNLTPNSRFAFLDDVSVCASILT